MVLALPQGRSGRIRCRRGQAVITKGYGLCDYVIHVVGSIFDGEKIEAGECLQDQRKKFKTCSSSRVRTLESCYREIVKVIREHPDIKNVAVPIISSGTYGFPFEMAADIAIATIGNALLEWQQEDGEYFNDTREGLQNIFFFICPRDEEKFEIVSGILAQYSQIFDSGNQVVAQNSLLSQKQYINEIKRYDKKRGYFCIARTTRLWLTCLRVISVYTYLKDIFGGQNWQRRRFWVELTVVLKIGIAVLIGSSICAWRTDGTGIAEISADIYFRLQPRRHHHLSDLPDPYGGYPEAFRQRDPFHAAPPDELCGSVN